MSEVTMLQGDCLDLLPTLPDKSVEAIITDLPYQQTACAWDEIIPFEPMWAQVKRILKPRGVFVTTASQPFTSKLVMSNIEWFKYEWIWDKIIPGNFGSVNFQPLRNHENIIVFSENGHTYNPQFEKASKRFGRLSFSKSEVTADATGFRRDGVGYPKTIQRFMRPNNITGGGLHPTQKPVSLYEYLILTYTNPGDTVLDFCAGSGTTGEAAILTGRNCILIEKDPGYFEIIQKRIARAQMQGRLFD